MLELRPLPKVTHLNALPIYEACEKLFERPTVVLAKLTAPVKTDEADARWYIEAVGLMTVMSKLDATRPEYFIKMDNGRTFGVCVAGPFAHWMQSDVLVRPTEDEYAELRLCL